MISKMALAEKLVYVNTFKPLELLKTEPLCRSVFTQDELKLTQYSFKNIYSCPDSEDFEIRLKTNKEILKIENKNSLKFYSHDPFFKYQWGLSNDGSSLFENASLLELTEYKGVKGADIGQVPDGENEILVAVVDSGIDLKHPDLMNQIHRTESECKMQLAYDECLKIEPDKNKCHEKYAKMDTDGNGYPLDCHGWNIAAPINPRTGIQGHGNVNDIIGHGTHIAGIIAAEKNLVGVEGVTQMAKILPVKVSGSDEEVPDVGVEIFAKGILYAIKSHAQVINLSLGWSLKEDSMVVRETIQMAMNKNILVIAAGGNAGQKVATYPCAYDGVICVGAHTKDGTLANFSNYGASIDIIAPGHKILSTWPTALRSKQFTEARGYEYKSGTSQATPFVTGSIAKLLSLGWDTEVVKMKILKGSKKYPSTKDFTQNGNLTLPLALTTEGSFLQLNKNTLLINDTGDEKTATLKFQILGGPVSGILNIKDLSGESIKTQEIEAATDIYELPFQIKNKNTHEFSNTLKIEFIGKDSQQNLYKDLEFFRYLDVETTANDIENYSFANSKSDHLKDLGCKNITGLAEFFCYKTVKNTVFVSFLKPEENLTTPLIPINLKRTIFPYVGLQDIDLDGEKEYLVMGFDQDKDKKWEAHFLFFNLKGIPKKIEYLTENKFKNEITTIAAHLKFKTENKQVQTCWISVGTRPESETQSGLWREVIKNDRTQYLYCLKNKELKTVNLNGFTPISFLKNDSLLAFKGVGTNREFSIFSWPDLIETKLPPLLIPFDFANSMPVLSNNENNYFDYSTGLNHYFTSLDPNLNQWTQAKFRYPMNASIIGFDESFMIFHTRFDIGLYDIESDTYVTRPATYETKRVEHLYLGQTHGLYLPSFRSSNLVSETIIPKVESGVTMISAPARYHILASSQCYEIGPLPDLQGQRDTIFYLCPDKLVGKRVFISR